MFPYDPQLLRIFQTVPATVKDLIAGLQEIDEICDDGDGAKWFNRVYLRVTQAVAERIDAGGFADPEWLHILDVQFGGLYYSAMRALLQGFPCPGCWRVPFLVRDDTRLARIQFALAGMNAHINHDLALAIVAAGRTTGIAPVEGTAQHRDFLSINPVLAGLIDEAKADLNIRLLGDPLPEVSHVGDTIAAWGLTAARSQAWKHGQTLWAVRDIRVLTQGFEEGIDGLTTFGNKALLVPAM